MCGEGDRRGEVACDVGFVRSWGMRSVGKGIGGGVDGGGGRRKGINNRRRLNVGKGVWNGAVVR